MPWRNCRSVAPSKASTCPTRRRSRFMRRASPDGPDRRHAGQKHRSARRARPRSPRCLVDAWKARARAIASVGRLHCCGRSSASKSGVRRGARSMWAKLEAPRFAARLETHPHSQRRGDAGRRHLAAESGLFAQSCWADPVGELDLAQMPQGRRGSIALLTKIKGTAAGRRKYSAVCRSRSDVWPAGDLAGARSIGKMLGSKSVRPRSSCASCRKPGAPTVGRRGLAWLSYNAVGTAL